MPSIPLATAGKVPGTSTLICNVCLTLDPFPPLSTNSHTAKTPCTTLQSKGHAAFSWSLNDPPKCAVDLTSSFTDVNAALLKMTQTHLQLDVQQDALF
jgi:hypothetical protein